MRCDDLRGVEEGTEFQDTRTWGTGLAPDNNQLLRENDGPELALVCRTRALKCIRCTHAAEKVRNCQPARHCCNEQQATCYNIPLGFTVSFTVGLERREKKLHTLRIARMSRREIRTSLEIPDGQTLTSAVAQEPRATHEAL
jgi:hypothetical protein